MSRRKPWQRPGGDVRAVDQAARNQALCAELAEVRAKLAATEAQLRWHKVELAAVQVRSRVATLRADELDLTVAALTGELEKEREWHAGNCSHAVELRAEREHARKQEKLIGQLQEINENYGRMELAAIEAVVAAPMAMSGGKRGRR